MHANNRPPFGSLDRLTLYHFVIVTYSISESRNTIDSVRLSVRPSACLLPLHFRNRLTADLEVLCASSGS